MAEKLLDTIELSKKENILLKSHYGNEIYKQIVLELIKDNIFERAEKQIQI